MKKVISSDYFLFAQKALQCDSCDSCDSFQRLPLLQYCVKLTFNRL